MLLDMEQQRDDEEGQPATLRYSQVGIQEHLLMSIDMGIKAMRAEAPFMNGAKGKPTYPDPWPMPETALERLRKAQEKDQATLLASAFGVAPEDI